MEATSGIEPLIGVLQTPALPLGHVAWCLNVTVLALELSIEALPRSRDGLYNRLTAQIDALHGTLCP